MKNINAFAVGMRAAWALRATHAAATAHATAPAAAAFVDGGIT